MPIVVNKDEKRRTIALSCKELLLEHGIKEISIAKIAQTAGVGKGTIYEYFSNKEDIVFEIISAFISDHEAELAQIQQQEIPVRKKIFQMLYTMYRDEYHLKQLMIYREYLAIAMTSEVEEMVAFSNQCRERFISILHDVLIEAVEKGELRPEAMTLVGTLHTYGFGLVVESKSVNIDPKILLEQMVNRLFALLEVK